MRTPLRLALSVAVILSALPSCALGGDADSPMPEPPAIPVAGVTQAAVVGEGAAIDVSQANSTGLFLASLPGIPSSRHKLVVSHGGETRAYEMPLDGTEVAVPANMGDGTYEVSVMRNVHASEYVPILSTEAEVSLSDDDAPFLSPNLMCRFSEGSACVRKAREIAASCRGQGEFAGKALEFVMGAVEYDDAKAAAAGATKDYVPDPDATLASGRGICFDYASLLAAMLRSCGIPARIVVGNVLPSGELHAWVEARVDGTWEGHGVSITPGEWSRIDVTFADGGTLDRAERYDPHRMY